MWIIWVVSILMITSMAPVLTAGGPRTFGSAAYGQEVAERILVPLWEEEDLHVTTRPHNRKLVYHPGTGHLFAFFGDGNDNKRNLYRVSSDGRNWTPARVAIHGNGHGSSQDYLRAGDRIFALFFPVTGDPALPRHYYVTDFAIAGNALVANATHIAIEGQENYSHFYGSLEVDSQGYLWVGSRGVERPSEVQTAHATRSARPLDHSEWGAPVPVSPPNIEGNAVPDMVALDHGRMLAVSYLGVNYWEQPGGIAKIYGALYEPGSGWSSSYLLTQASNAIRPVAEYDASSGRVHLLYGDTAGDLRHRILSAPHGQGDWSPAPGTPVAQAVQRGDGVEFDMSFGLDKGRSPAGIWAAYPQGGVYEMRYYNGADWQAERFALNQEAGEPPNEASMLRDVTEHVSLVYLDDGTVMYGELVLSATAPLPTPTPTPSGEPSPSPTASPTPASPPAASPTPTKSADLNGDGRVDGADLRLLGDAWRESRESRES